MSTTSIQITSAAGISEITEATDLSELLIHLYDYADGDILVVTSKIVSKAEGRTRPGTRDDWLASETERVVATRGATSIVRNRLGLTMAAAGIDSSNVAAGTVVLLPEDPDSSARVIRDRLRAATGRNVAVVVTDTAGRAWRDGQTDIAIGAAGLVVAESFAGRRDEHGNDLMVTMPAVADEIAGAAELAQGKLGGRPTALLRGRADLVMAPGSHGAGAAALVRPDGADLFGWGSREAVLRALRGDQGDRAPFGAPVDLTELVGALGHLSGASVTVLGSATARPVRLELTHSGLPRAASIDPVALSALCFAFGWQVLSTRAEAAAAPNVVGRLSVQPF